MGLKNGLMTRFIRDYASSDMGIPDLDPGGLHQIQIDIEM